MRVSSILDEGGEEKSETMPPILLLRVTRDDLSLWASCFREALESARSAESAKVRLRSTHADLRRCLNRLQELLASEPGPPRVFAVDPAEDPAIRCRLAKLAGPPDLNQDTGLFLIATTDAALFISLLCAREMQNYLWSEEVHAITGYDAPEVDGFVSSMQKIVDERSRGGRGVA